MAEKFLIEEKLLESHENFLEYCRETGKRFVGELSEEDFVAYGAKYFVSRAELVQLKILLGVKDSKRGRKKISQAKKKSGESWMSLRKYFLRPENAVQYESVPLSALDLRERVLRRLAENGYETIGQVLKVTRKKILSLKAFGEYSLDELLAALKKFFDSQRKEIPAEILEMGDEELEEFLRSEISKPNPQGKFLIAALERFPLPVRVEKFLKCLPAEILSKRAQPFLQACGLDKIELPAEVTLAQLPARHNFTAEEPEKFIGEFCFDIRARVRNFLAALFRKEGVVKILLQRAAGKRLRQIGQEVGLTRERVRQVALIAVDTLSKREDEVLKNFFFLRALNEGSSFLTLADMKKFLAADDATLLFFLASKMNFRRDVLHFDAGLNAFVFHGSANLNEEELTKNLPDVMDEKFFNKAALKLAREKNCAVDLIKSKVLKSYKRSGKFFHRERLTLTFKYAYVLKEKFPEGYKVNDKNCYVQIVRHLKEIFDLEFTPTFRAVDAMIGRIGLLVGRGRYVHPDSFHVPEEVIARVKNFIDSSEREAISYKEIFESLKDVFAGTQITNPYILQGVIKFLDLPYTFRKDYLTKADKVSVTKEFESFIADRGEVTLAEIRKKFVGFSRLNIDVMIKRCPEILQAGKGKFVHASRLNLHTEDFEPIRKFLRENCSEAVSARVLLKVFVEDFGGFMARNDIKTAEKLFDVLHYMFGDEFNFSNHYISVDSSERITGKKILLRALEDKESVNVREIFEIRDRNAMGHATKTYLIELMSPEFVRVDRFNLARPESVGITRKIVAAVAEIIHEAMERNGGWLTAQSFRSYERLPKLLVPWNSFLLAGVMLLAQDGLPRLRIPSTSPDFCRVIFLSKEFAGEDFQSFVQKILTSRHEKKPFRSEEEVFIWMKSHCLSYKELPKFLRDGKLSEILG